VTEVAEADVEALGQHLAFAFAERLHVDAESAVVDYAAGLEIVSACSADDAAGLPKA
jgi:hypothetical protein